MRRYFYSFSIIFVLLLILVVSGVGYGIEKEGFVYGYWVKAGMMEFADSPNSGKVLKLGGYTAYYFRVKSDDYDFIGVAFPEMSSNTSMLLMTYGSGYIAYTLGRHNAIKGVETLVKSRQLKDITVALYRIYDRYIVLFTDSTGKLIMILGGKVDRTAFNFSNLLLNIIHVIEKINN